MNLIERLGHFIRQTFRRETPPPLHRTPAELEEEAVRSIAARTQAEERLQFKKRKPKYSEERAKEVLHLLENLPADNPLQGLTFTRQTLINNPGLANLITDMRYIQIVDNQPTAELLVKKLRDIVYIKQELRHNPTAGTDLNSLNNLEDRVSRRIDIIAAHAMPDQRRVEFAQDIVRARQMPAERNEPPSRYNQHFERPKSPLPLDFTGHYGPIDPRIPQDLKNIIDRVRAHPDIYNDSTLVDPEDRHSKLRCDEPLEQLKRDLQQILTNSDQYLRRTQPHLVDQSRVITIKDILPYTQSIDKHLKLMYMKVGKEYSESRALAQFGISEVVLRTDVDKYKDDPKKRTTIFESVFYKLLYRVVGNPHEQYTRTFSLYETEAMNEILDIITEYEGGYELADRLRNKMYGVFAAHDAIVIALNPAADEEAWKAITTFSRNSFTQDMMDDPLAEQLVNLYERVLWDILRTYDGHIPAELVEPAGKGEFVGDSRWDRMVEERFMQMVDAGVIYDAEKDDNGAPKKDKNGKIMWDRKNPVRRAQFDGEGRWRLVSAMGQAKGFGLLSGRLLEIFGLQRVPSFKPEDQPDIVDSDKVFSSVPYEGIARFLNPAHLFTKCHVADDKFRAYWNLIVWEGDEKHRDEWFDVNESKKVFEAVRNGTLEEEYPEFAKRFLDKYTWGMFSGRFGPWSTFGVRDAIIGMSDKQREYLGGSIRLAFMNELWAKEDVKELLGEHEFKEVFRAELIHSGRMKYKPNGDADEDWFEREWRKVGKNNDPRLGLYTREIMHEWEHLNKRHKGEIDALTKEIKNIYNTMSWMQLATRSPHIVVRNTFVFDEYAGKLRKKSLRDKILEEMFPGLDVEQFFHRGGGYTQAHEKWMREQIGVLEGDIDIVAHKALYEEAGPREIQDADFENIVAYKTDAQGYQVKDEGETMYRKMRAREYFRKAKMAVLGSWSNMNEEQLMSQFGLRYVGERLEVDWDRVWDRNNYTLRTYRLRDGSTGSYLDHMLDQMKAASEADPSARPYFQLDKRLISEKQRYLMSTEDVVWDKMEIINLGYRHWARRGGDLDGQAKGLKAEMKYIIRGLSVTGDMKKILDSFHEISAAYEEDDKYFSNAKIGLHAQATAKFFKQGWQWSKTGSVGKILSLFMDSSLAQKVSSRTVGVAWDSNKLFEFAHTLGAENLLPWKPESFLEDTGFGFDVEQLEHETGGTRLHALYEVISMAWFIALMFTVYQAITKKSEEEEGSEH